MTISYFGYGSLVNVNTLPAGANVVSGQLSGWVREWRIWGTTQLGRQVCTLSVAPKEGVTIRGVMAKEPKERLAELDQREAKYHRVPGIGSSFICDARGEAGPPDMFLYRSKPEHYGWGSDDYPILQSYVDCVLQGFHAFWGLPGVDHFLETTDGWHVPILKDRDAPIYPRAQQVPPELLAEFDARLKASGVRYLDLG